MRGLRPTRRPAQGFTLLELLVTIAIAALLSAAAAPSIGAWAANARVRSVAEQLQNDVRMAQAEAVRRSRQTVLALTNATPAWNATPAADGSNWYVRAQPLASSDETASSASLVTANLSAKNFGITITGPALTCFGSLGQRLSVSSDDTGLSTACTTGNNPEVYTVSHTNANRSLKVLVYLGGRVFMCDAAKTQSDTNPDGCP